MQKHKDKYIPFIAFKKKKNCILGDGEWNVVAFFNWN